MTSTTITAPMAATSRFVCIDHGVLADDAVVCTRCGSKPWDLDDAAQFERAVAYQKTSLKTRAKNYAIMASVTVNLVDSMWRSIATERLVIHFSLSTTIVGMALATCVAWLWRPRAVHGLVRALRARGARVW